MGAQGIHKLWISEAEMVNGWRFWLRAVLSPLVALLAWIKYRGDKQVND